MAVENKGGKKGLIIGLVAGIVVLLAVIVVMGIKLLGTGGDTAVDDTSGRKTRTAATKERSGKNRTKDADTADTENTGDAADTSSAEDTTVMAVSEAFLNQVPGYYESREMPWVLFINPGGTYQAVTTRTGIEETGTWEAVWADRGDGVMADMIYLRMDGPEEVTDTGAPLIWMEEERCFIIGPWEGEDGSYQHLDPAPYPKAIDGGGDLIGVSGILSYTVRMPAEWQDNVVAEIINADTPYPAVNFYLASDYENGADGLMFTLQLVEEPELLPTRYEIVGSQVRIGFSVGYLTAVFPGGVTYSSQAAAGEAEKLLAYREALYDSVESPVTNYSYYSPAVAGHRQEALYYGVRNDYQLSVLDEMDEAALQERGLSTCFLDLAGMAVDWEAMQCAFADLNDDGTDELLILYYDDVRAIHSIGEDGVPVLVYTCPYRSVMTILQDNTICVMSSVDGSVRYYRLTAYLSGLVDAGEPQTDGELYLFPEPM